MTSAPLKHRGWAFAVSAAAFTNGFLNFSQRFQFTVVASVAVRAAALVDTSASSAVHARLNALGCQTCKMYTGATLQRVTRG